MRRLAGMLKRLVVAVQDEHDGSQQLVHSLEGEERGMEGGRDREEEKGVRERRKKRERDIGDE